MDEYSVMGNWNLKLIWDLSFGISSYILSLIDSENEKS
jgi:hypothetical protein